MKKVPSSPSRCTPLDLATGSVVGGNGSTTVYLQGNGETGILHSFDGTLPLPIGEGTLPFGEGTLPFTRGGR